MSAPELKTSTRLLRAAEAERAELHQQRTRLGTSRAAALARLREIERVLAELDDRERLLDQIAPRPVDGADIASGPVPPSTTVMPVGNGVSATDNRAQILRGPAIRETAVRLLVGRGGIEAMYYREWYALLTRAGYTVAGKDGLAVFLTQISRSPAVRKGTQAGVYELDRDAPRRLARETEHLQGELRELTGLTLGTSDLSEIRARREQLTSAIGQVERALEEAQRVLAAGVDGGGGAALAVAAAV